MGSVSDKTLSETFNGLNPLSAPALYSRHFGKHENTITMVAEDGRLMKLEMLSSLDDHKTGFRGDVMIDKSTGHAIILYKGMDTPFKDMGNGRTGFLRDAFTAAQTWFTGARNMQTPFAEKLYQDTVQNPDVKSVEIVGFSLGTLHANYMAAKYGVKATVLADLGIADKGLKKMFNNAADGSVDTAHKNLDQNVTVLRMALDLIPAFGPGPHHGKVINLDDGALPDASGLTHLASNYDKKAQQIIHGDDDRTLIALKPAPTLIPRA